jgi:hypothetical protein
LDEPENQLPRRTPGHMLHLGRFLNQGNAGAPIGAVELS